MPLDPELLEEAFYLPEGLMIDEVLEVDEAESLVRVRMPTHDALPLTNLQRVHPERHPRHVSGGLIVHMTGVAGMVHAHYVFGLRHSEGWVGYGGAIHKGRFKNLAPPGEPGRKRPECPSPRRGRAASHGRRSCPACWASLCRCGSARR